MVSKEKWKIFEKRLGTKKVFAGFDGYTDMLYSVVQQEKGEAKQVFRRSEDFARRLLETSGISSEYEILLKCKRLGGNAPLMSIGMAAMGAAVSCAGLFGEKETEIENRLTGRLKLYSMGEPAVTVALEFEDCKYMLADCGKLQYITYKKLEEALGQEDINDKILEADLIAAVNWAALPELRSILEKLFISRKNIGKMAHKWLFLDLSDIRKKEGMEIKIYFRTIEQIAEYTGIKTCLSLNENELHVLAKKLDIIENSEVEKLREIRKCLKIREIILHAMKKSMYCSEEEIAEVPKEICRHPIITTGAGDNFNAGVCVGKLLGLPPASQIEMGNFAAEFYVTYGYSGNLEEILKWKEG
jgi:Sugar kinases, ribokinase family